MYTEIIPTYLYIKQHSVTGLKYFGKTTKPDPIKYLGSGKYWKSHIKKHGKEHVVTLWCQLFDTQELLTDFALLFSEHWDIVNSKVWANLILENGLDGTIPGTIFGPRSDETKAKISASHIGKIVSDETKAKLSEINTGKVLSTETKAKISASNTGQKRTEETKAKMSASRIGMKVSDEVRINMSKPKSDQHKVNLTIAQKLRWINNPCTDETKLKMSNIKKGIPKRIIECPHCGKSGGELQMCRWHFNNCKSLSDD